MRFGFKVFMSAWLSKRLRSLLNTYSSLVLLGILLALIVCMNILIASLHYPFTLLTVHDTVSADVTLYPVCSKQDSNATLVRYDILKPQKRPNFECINTKTSPPVTVCLFDIWHDVYVSRSLQSAGIWEPYLVNEFTEAVRRGGPEAGVCVLSICLYQLSDSFTFLVLSDVIILAELITRAVKALIFLMH